MNIEERLQKYLKEQKENASDEFLSDLMETVFDFIDSLDLNELSDEQQDMVEEILDMYNKDHDDDDDEDLEEQYTAKKKKVVRGGKRQKKRICGAGFKKVNGRCVRMTSSEKRVRSRAAKRGAKKRRGRQTQITRKRQRSIRKRT